jgi:hypothetical protein
LSPRHGGQYARRRDEPLFNELYVASDTGGICQAAICGDERTVEGFSESDVYGVIRSEIILESEHAWEEGQCGVTHDRKRGEILDGGLESRGSHLAGEP